MGCELILMVGLPNIFIAYLLEVASGFLLYIRELFS